MSESNSPRIHLPTALSTFAGIFGSGLLDAVLVAFRGQQASLAEALTLAVGLYGIAGIMAGVLFGWAVATVLAALPGGWQGLLADEQLDNRVAGILLGATTASGVLAAGMGLGHKSFVASMHSQLLATIATAGLAVVMAIPAGLVLLATWRPMAVLAGKTLPRLPRLGRAGLLLCALAALGVLAFVAALSRSDWRVLDLGPLWTIALALVLGVAHGVFWYVLGVGKRLGARLPRRILRPLIAVAVVAALVAGSQIGESSNTYASIDDNGLGLKIALKLVRKLTDRDGDGYSALFGGGDCDGARADVFPGADDIPGDGVDQNCLGGDAPLPSATPADSDKPAPAKPHAARANAFKGNILIIAVDATRADRLGVAGYGRPPGKSLTPNIDALAKRGAYFRRVWAQAPNTPRSFPSFATSRHPSEIAWKRRTLNYSPLLPSNHTFFEPMVPAGIKLIGIFSHFYFTGDRGISKGFAEWSNEGAKSIADSNKDIAAPRIVPRVIDRLKQAASTGERFLLWTHLFEPHSSYMPHPEFPTKLSGLAGLEEKYDYEIAFDDMWVGKILKTLEETKLSENTAIVVFGDHGEAWGEHRIYFHGQDLTEEQLRVPLIFVIPGRKPVVSDDEVGLVDVGPTLLDLLGIDAPANLRGRSLLPAIDGGTLPPKPVFAELLPSTSTPDHQVTMVDRGKKLLHKLAERRFELFDLTTDPKQKKNIANIPANRELLEELKAKLLAFEEKRLP